MNIINGRVYNIWTEFVMSDAAEDCDDSDESKEVDEGKTAFIRFPFPCCIAAGCSPEKNNGK